MNQWLNWRRWWAMGLLALPIAAAGQYVTLSGTLQASNGLPAPNYTIAFTPNQFGFIAGTGVVVNTTTYCGTDPAGAVVGITNPLQPTLDTPSYITGSLPAANYFVQFAWYTSTGTVTQVSPESTAQLTAQGSLQVAPPAGGLPAGVEGMLVAIGTTSGGETLQGTTTGTNVYTQSVPLVTTPALSPVVLTPTPYDQGAAPHSLNTTVCQEVANDAIWPTGTGYTVSLTDPSGNTLPGYPMMWQLTGSNSTLNLSNGLPYYHGVVTFPAPILASPQNHAQQSISGPLSLGSYYATAGGFGVGVLSPLYGMDAEGSGNYGRINAKNGYLVNGSGGTVGQCLGSDGTAFDTVISCITSVGSLYYQTVASNGTAQTQRATLSFSPRFTLTDSSSPAETTVDLSSGVVTPGSCTNCALTVDTYGRVTSASSGGSGSFSSGSNGNGAWVIDPIGTITERGCVADMGVSDYAQTFPTAFTTTTNLSVVTQIVYPSGYQANTVINAGSINTTGFTIHQAGVNDMGMCWIAIGN